MASSANELRPATGARLAELEELFDQLMPLLREYEAANGRPDQTKVIEYRLPEALKAEFDLHLDVEGHSSPEVIEAVAKLLRYSVRTSHPRFLNQLYAGSDPIGHVGELVKAVVNTNCYTYTVAPVFSLMEIEIVQRVAALAGFDTATSEGILGPGGSYANMVGMVAARHHAFPHVRLDGWKPEDRPVVFTSAQAHYSILRAAMMLGIGMNNVIRVAADRQGRMIPAALAEAVIAQKALGKHPFLVSATAGTTIMGGFDPLEPLADICKEHNLWLHVDAAWGGASLFSSKHRHLMSGIERVDSMAWDFHKGLGVPVLAAGVLVNNHKGILRAANNSSADYLFHPTPTSAYDIGDMSLQCGRQSDSIKIWLSWYRHGLSGFEARVNHAMEMAQHLHARIAADSRYVVVEPPTYCNVCFWYLPKCLRGIADLESIYGRLDVATQALFRAMTDAGTMMFNYNPLTDHGLPRFFRLITVAPWVTTEDLDFVVEELDRLGADLIV